MFLLWLEKRGGVGETVHKCIIFVPPGPQLSHKVRLELQGRVVPFCFLGRKGDMTEDMDA